MALMLPGGGARPAPIDALNGFMQRPQFRPPPPRPLGIGQGQPFDYQGPTTVGPGGIATGYNFPGLGGQPVPGGPPPHEPPSLSPGPHNGFGPGGPITVGPGGGVVSGSPILGGRNPVPGQPTLDQMRNALTQLHMMQMLNRMGAHNNHHASR